MIVINHCGVNNTCYQTSHLPHPYSPVPSPNDGSVSVDYIPGKVPWGVLHMNAQEYLCDLVSGYIRRHITGNVDDDYEISHAITVTDTRFGKFTVFLDKQSEYRNWVFVFFPTAIYKYFKSPFNPADAKWIIGNPLGNRGADNRSVSGYKLGCWRIYYGCTVCRAYTNIPWKRKLAVTDGDTVDSSWELYLVWPERYKCQQCKSWVFDSSITSPGARLGKSFNVIFCWMDQCYRWQKMMLLGLQIQQPLFPLWHVPMGICPYPLVYLTMGFPRMIGPPPSINTGASCVIPSNLQHTMGSLPTGSLLQPTTGPRPLRRLHATSR